MQNLDDSHELGQEKYICEIPIATPATQTCTCSSGAPLERRLSPLPAKLTNCQAVKLCSEQIPKSCSDCNMKIHVPWLCLGSLTAEAEAEMKGLSRCHFNPPPLSITALALLVGCPQYSKRQQAKHFTHPCMCVDASALNSAPHRQCAPLFFVSTRQVETVSACSCVAIQLIFSDTHYYRLMQTWCAGSYGFYKNNLKALSLCQLPDVLLPIVFLVSKTLSFHVHIIICFSSDSMRFNMGKLATKYIPIAIMIIHHYSNCSSSSSGRSSGSCKSNCLTNSSTDVSGGINICGSARGEWEEMG